MTAIPIKETPMTELLMVRQETQIAAPPSTVFAFLTDPEKIISWMGTEAKTEMRPGGIYLLKGVNNRRVARGTFREVVPVHRLVYSFDANAEGTGIPQLLRRLGELEIDFKDLDTTRSSLEDIFVSLVKLGS